MPMRHHRLLVFIFLIILACILSPDPSRGSETAGSGFDEKIAAVNGVGITKRDFIWALSSEEQRLTSSGKILTPEEKNDLKRSVLDQLVNREILYQESRKKNIVVSELKIEQEYGRIRASMMSDIDLETIKKELDMDENHIKNEFRRVFAIKMLMAQELVIDDSVTEKETRDFYDSNPDKFIIPGPIYVRHILIQVKPGADETRKADARKKAEEIYEKVKAGEDFSELAKAYSEGPSAVKGGAIGWLKTGRTVKAFEDAAFALGVGEVSGIVETPYGFHIIKVTDKKPDRVFAYDDIQEQLSDYLKKQKVSLTEKAYIEKLKKKATIEQFVDILTME